MPFEAGGTDGRRAGTEARGSCPEGRLTLQCFFAPSGGARKSGHGAVDDSSSAVGRGEARGASGGHRSRTIHVAGGDRLGRRVFRPDGHFGDWRADSMDICSVEARSPRQGGGFTSVEASARCGARRRSVRGTPAQADRSSIGFGTAAGSPKRAPWRETEGSRAGGNTARSEPRQTGVPVLCKTNRGKQTSVERTGVIALSATHADWEAQISWAAPLLREGGPGWPSWSCLREHRQVPHREGCRSEHGSRGEIPLGSASTRVGDRAVKSGTRSRSSHEGASATARERDRGRATVPWGVWQHTAGDISCEAANPSR